MKSAWMMSEAELQTLPLWEEGSKLAGKPVYLSIENWNNVWQLFTANDVSKLINGSTLQMIAGCNPICNKDFGNYAVILVNSAVTINAGTLEFFMFHELGHIVREHGTKRIGESEQIAGILSNINIELEADQYAYEKTGIRIDFQAEFKQMIPWSFEKLCGTYDLEASVDELVAMTLANPDIQTRQNALDALVKASVAS